MFDFINGSWYIDNTKTIKLSEYKAFKRYLKGSLDCDAFSKIIGIEDNFKSIVRMLINKDNYVENSFFYYDEVLVLTVSLGLTVSYDNYGCKLVFSENELDVLDFYESLELDIVVR